jgi:hypothetical protein
VEERLRGRRLDGGCEGSREVSFWKSKGQRLTNEDRQTKREGDRSREAHREAVGQEQGEGRRSKEGEVDRHPFGRGRIEKREREHRLSVGDGQEEIDREMEGLDEGSHEESWRERSCWTTCRSRDVLPATADSTRSQAETSFLRSSPAQLLQAVLRQLLRRSASLPALLR